MDVDSSIADIAKILEEEKTEDEGCELCKQIDEDIKKVYFESKKMIVMNCRDCDCPVVVFKKHTEKARTRVDGQMIWRLSKICDTVYGKHKWTLDKDTKENLEHVHYHGRQINKGEK